MLCRVLCALLLVAWTAESPLEKVLYCGYWRSPFQALGPLFEPLPAISLFPWQVVMILLAGVCLLSPGAFRKRAWLMDAAILTSFAAIAVTFVWGWIRGGSAYNAYFQLWKFLLALVVGLMGLSVIRKSRDLRALGLTILTAAVVRGTLAIYFYWAIVHGRIDPAPPYMTTHDDSVLFVAGILIVLSWALARGKVGSWLAAGVASAHLLYAITLNNRRLAWIELLLVLGVAYCMLPRGRVRRRVNLALAVAAPFLVVYVMVGQGRQEPMFAPVRALSTAGSYEDNSSMAREEEIRNLLYTLSAAGNPLLGTGWGMPYQKLTSVYANFDEVWWQYAYFPHNSLIGVAAFSGLVGMAGIWLVVPVAAFLGMRGYRGSAGVIDRAAAMAAVAILPAYGAQCYGDIGFQSFTGGLILGVALAVAGKVSAWAEATATIGSPRPRRGRVGAVPQWESLQEPPHAVAS